MYKGAIRKMEPSLADPQQYLENDLQFHMIIARTTLNSILQTSTPGYLQALD